jgi:Tol biopolymer transport system component
MPLAGGTASPLGTSTVSRTAPTVAGARVAFVSQVSSIDRVWMGDGVVNNALLDSTVNNTATLEGDPALSPDGSRIAWWSSERGRPEVVVRPTNGGAKVRLTGTNAAFAPAWRPDGQRVVLAWNRDTSATGPVSLYEVDPATGSAVRLTRRTQSDSDPEYLADGRVVYVAFTSGSRGELRWVHPAIPGLSGTIPLPEGLPSKPRRLP